MSPERPQKDRPSELLWPRFSFGKVAEGAIATIGRMITVKACLEMVGLAKIHHKGTRISNIYHLLEHYEAQQATRG